LCAVSAAVLAAGWGAVLSHEPGTALWGVPGFRLLPAEVSQTADRARRRQPIGRLHDLVLIPERWVTTFEGIRVVRPELALYQLCARIHPDRAERAFDTAWSMNLLSGRSARACLEEMRASGRNGTSVYESIVASRGDGYVPPTNNLEGRVAQLAAQAGIDFIEDDVRLVVEVQSERHHSALCDKRADEIRHESLEADGFSVLEVWDADVWTRGSHVVSRLHQAIGAARARRFSLSNEHKSVSV
jgi:hypothetical protein